MTRTSRARIPVFTRVLSLLMAVLLVLQEWYVTSFQRTDLAP